MQQAQDTRYIWLYGRSPFKKCFIKFIFDFFSTFLQYQSDTKRWIEVLLIVEGPNLFDLSNNSVDIDVEKMISELGNITSEMWAFSFLF